MILFAQYIKQRWRIFTAGALFCVIFIITFALYKLPIKAVTYPFMLCFLLIIIFMIIDFMRIKCRHDILIKIQGFTDIITESLPRIEGIEDEDYQNILRLLSKEHTDFITDSSRKYSELVDYYTVWAHQIKTPIASMRLTLQNEDNALSRKLSNDLFRIEQYVEMVLTFLRLNSESTDYVIKEYDLDKIVKQSVKKFAGEFIDRKLRLIYEPLNTAVLHLSFAFPMVQKLLALFNLRNILLMITVLAVAVLVFGVFYGIVYKVTSNAYYAIVSGRKDQS